MRTSKKLFFILRKHCFPTNLTEKAVNKYVSKTHDAQNSKKRQFRSSNILIFIYSLSCNNLDIKLFFRPSKSGFCSVPKILIPRYLCSRVVYNFLARTVMLTILAKLLVVFPHFFRLLVGL